MANPKIVNADLLLAWLQDGKTLQFKASTQYAELTGVSKDWQDYQGDVIPAVSRPDFEWRIKPMRADLILNILDNEKGGVYIQQHPSFEAADIGANQANFKRLACIKLSFSEGEGLDPSKRN
jgi:hypothetical protein